MKLQSPIAIYRPKRYLMQGSKTANDEQTHGIIEEKKP